VDQRFLDDLKLIRHKNLIAPEYWGLFQTQLKREWEHLDRQWEKISKKTDYPPLSTHDYRKRYMHSVPLGIKVRDKWDDHKSDFRIIFKVDEEMQEIYYLGIGKRFKGFPKNPDDVWEKMKDRQIPEEE